MITISQMQDALEAYAIHGSQRKAAEALGIPKSTFYDWLQKAQMKMVTGHQDQPFDIQALPSELPSLPELMESRKREFERKKEAKKARRLINVKIKIDGPIGITHFGDPHVDDPGTDISQLERDVKTVSDTEGLFGGNIGDLQNNWVGRLSHLYGEQSVSAQESWMLTEWLVNSIPWLYIIGGNHDCWSGAGDPLKWMMQYQQGILEAHGARLGLQFPNGKEVRVNARHDFQGHSQWNPVHGPSKAAQMGWRDHILTAGHKHVSGCAILKCPATGLITHALRCAGYKKYDRYADQLGLPDQSVSPCVTTIIDPAYADDDPRLLTVLWDTQEAADFLTFKRKKHGL
ncbi:MAG: helix-turn-helix domain-containing protein [Candidatus Thalassarchaeaceae archaeon]